MNCWKCHQNYVPVDVSGVGAGDMACITCGASTTPPRRGHRYVSQDSDETVYTPQRQAVLLQQTEVVLYQWPTRWTGERENPTRLRHVVTVHWTSVVQTKRAGAKPIHVIATEGLAGIKDIARSHIDTHRISLLVLRQFCQRTGITPEDIRGLTHFGFTTIPVDYEEVRR